MAFSYPTESELTDKSRRAGERFNNPFNMWYDKYANSVGGLQGRQITQFDTPSVFPSKILGASAAIRKMAESPLYSGKTMQDLIGTWVGHGESYAPIISQATGIPTSTRITPQFLQSPDGMRFLQTMARYETQWEQPYPLTQQDWETARRIAFDPQFRSQYVTTQGGPASTAATLAGAAVPPSSSPASTTPAAPTDVPRTGVGGLGAGSQGRGGINLPTSGGALADNSGNPIAPRVVAQAEKLAASGNIPGVQQFVRSQGYNVDPNWCGEFTGAVIKSAGGTPPKGGEVASSWLNWGTHVNPENMQPGDVAVYRVGTYGERQGQPLSPGDLGGHVGIVGSGGYDPKSGTFNMVDNHGQPHSLSTANIEFRRAPAGDAAMANTQNGSQTQAPAYGPPTPPGSIVQGGRLYNPAGGQPGQVPQRMGAKGGGMYIPIVSDILGAFTGSMGRKGGGMYATQAGAAQGATPDSSGQYGLPDGTTTQPGTIPAGPPQRWNPDTQSWDIGVGPGTPPPQGTTASRPLMQPSVFNPPAQPSGQPGALSPSTPSLAPSSKFPPVPWPAGGPATTQPTLPYTTIPGTAGQVPIQPGVGLMPGEVGPRGAGPSAVQQMMGLGARPLPPPAATPLQAVAQRFPQFQQAAAPPAANAPDAAPAGAPRGYSAATGGPNAPSPYGPGGPYANPYNPGGVGAPAGLAARGIPSPAEMLNAINPVSSAAAAPQPPGANVPIPRPNPIAGTQTALSIPPRGPWPPRPPGAPNPPPGDTTTVAGIPLPRPRPGMPANPPAQIPQPQGPTPQQAPAPAAPSSAPSDLLPQAGSFAERFAGAPGGPGTGQFQNPALAAALAQAAAARAPQSTAQGGPVAPGGPGQSMTPAQWLADKKARGMATGDWDPAFEGPRTTGPPNAFLPPAPAMTQSQFVPPAAAARQQFLQDRAQALLGPNASMANAMQFQGVGLAPPAGGPYPDPNPNLIPLPRPGGGFNPAIPRFIGPEGAPSGAVAPPYQGEKPPPLPPNAQGSTDAMNQAMIDYLRRQMQQPQGGNPWAGAN